MDGLPQAIRLQSRVPMVSYDIPAPCRYIRPGKYDLVFHILPARRPRGCHEQTSKEPNDCDFLRDDCKSGTVRMLR